MGQLPTECLAAILGQFLESNREIVAAGKTDQSKPLIVGNRVFDKLLTTEDITAFTRRKYHLLQLLRRGVPIEEAAQKSDVPLDEAVTFQESPKAQEYLRDRELAAILAEEAQDSDRWWLRVEAVLSGQMQLNKGQTETLKEAGKRVAPISESHGSGPTKIEIHIDPEALERYRAKRKAIDAQVIP